MFTRQIFIDDTLPNYHLGAVANVVDEVVVYSSVKPVGRYEQLASMDIYKCHLSMNHRWPITDNTSDQKLFLMKGVVTRVLVVIRENMVISLSIISLQLFPSRYCGG